MSLVRNSLILVFFAVAFLATGSIASDAKVIVKQNTKYYSVKGLNGLEISKAMLVGGKKNINLRHAIAATATSFKFTNSKVKVDGRKCKLESIDINLSITYYYPKWQGRNQAGANVRRAWDVFYKELLRHEQTHGKIAIDFANQLEREMLKMSGNVVAGCRDFGSTAIFKLKSLSNQLKQKQAAFDRLEERSTSKISRLQIALLKSK
ncbi:MAG: DUF922 domain-containing protein [Rhizobiaceae bacterium]